MEPVLQRVTADPRQLGRYFQLEPLDSDAGARLEQLVPKLRARSETTLDSLVGPTAIADPYARLAFLADVLNIGDGTVQQLVPGSALWVWNPPPPGETRVIEVPQIRRA